MDVVITGSSGLIGRALIPALTAAGHRPIRLVRREPQAGRDEIRWDPAAGEIDAASLEGADAVINLAGAGIGDKRWNDAYRRLLVTRDGRGVVTADGAEQASVTPLNGGLIEVTVGGDRYRLPAMVKPSGQSQ